MESDLMTMAEVESFEKDYIPQHPKYAAVVKQMAETIRALHDDGLAAAIEACALCYNWDVSEGRKATPYEYCTCDDCPVYVFRAELDAMGGGVLKSSMEWAVIKKVRLFGGHPIDDPKIIVHDPDGWDRTRLSESFSEKITEVEFNTRIVRSTIEVDYRNLMGGGDGTSNV